MPHVCADGKFNGVSVEFLRCRRPAHTTRVLLARMFSYRLLRVVRATWKEFADASRERFDVRGVEFRPPWRPSFPILQFDCPTTGIQLAAGFSNLFWAKPAAQQGNARYEM